MYNIWFERTLPNAYLPLLNNIAVAVGAATDTPDRPFAAVAKAQAIIAGGRLTYSAAVMDQVPNLRVISRSGIGVNNVDIDAATARGIAVCNTPDAPTISTAEHTIGLMLAVAKQLNWCRQALLAKERSDFFNAYSGLELNGQRLGVVGLGRIGRRVARLAQGLGMSVIGFDPFVPAKQARELGVEPAATLQELLRAADVVSLHVPLLPETRNIINAGRLAQMKPGAILINAARGGLVDEDALLNALETGHLWGAGLDVFTSEPPLPDHPLLGRVDVVATPHIASATGAGKDRLWRAAIAQALQVLRGERPPHLVNAQVWPLD